MKWAFIKEKVWKTWSLERFLYILREKKEKWEKLNKTNKKKNPLGDVKKSSKKWISIIDAPFRVPTIDANFLASMKWHFKFCCQSSTSNDYVQLSYKKVSKTNDLTFLISRVQHFAQEL